MRVSESDKTILRELAKRTAQIAALPIQREKARMWNRLNRLEGVRPMLWVNEIPWHEMDLSGELTLRCEQAFCREQEQWLRRQLYQWDHMRGDMVIEPVIYSPVAVRDSGFGMETREEIAVTDARSDVVSHHYTSQLRDESDLEKIRTPVVAVDHEATRANAQAMKDIFDGILTVESRVVERMRFSPWDDLVQWWGVEELMLDLVMRPELVRKAIDRLVGAYLSRLDQYEALGLLSLNNGNFRIGSGGYGYADELPGDDYDPQSIRAANLWGYAQAQIFCSVSPEMHDEFALRYEKKWLERFGLTYYGCCEPLHRKIHILETIPNLRKVSMSCWIDVQEAAANVRGRFVFSYKPSPAVFATTRWDEEAARAELARVFKLTLDCPVEIIMKDISTVNYQPQRLWEWMRMAGELAQM